MMQIFPDFSLEHVLIAPWREEWQSSLVLVAMGFLVAATCGLVGVFLLLRRMAMMGDVLSHSLLPGIVVAFLLSGSRATGPLWVGALLAGMVTILLVEGIQRFSRLKADAAMGIVFSTLFALGVVMVNIFARQVDLDAECVLYGELLYIILDEPVMLAGINLGPPSLVRMMFLALGVCMLIGVFYKELLITSFDSALAAAMGLPTRAFHYGSLLLLSVIIVSVFEAVGAILVVAMLVFPGATALLVGKRLPVVLGWTIASGFLASLGGFHLGVWLEVSLAASMATMAMILFAVVWISSRVFIPLLLTKKPAGVRQVLVGD